MSSLPDRLTLRTTPLAHPESMITGEHWRITVLTERLFRVEYSPSGQFEDRATQTVVNRQFPVPGFSVEHKGAGVEVSTPTVTLFYDGGPFSARGLYAHLAGGRNHRRIWRYGEIPLDERLKSSNLGGTARTLDVVDGATELEPGLISTLGSAALDDSQTLALGADGWIAPRIEGNLDLYLFAHGHDARGALADFFALTGPQPLLPRYALGNWWSRYHPYTADEYQAVIERFEAERLPFSVAVIDMDWHLVDIPPEYGTGWTGYTWNRDLFPDPEGFLAWLHERGLKVSLNVHPADGIRAYEECYPAMAESMGIDPASRRPVEFDIADPAFLVNYFEQVHHPLEDQGVDFWWLDWQQGTHTAVAGLDPLWMLNHFHFLDSARRGGRRITFSRYAGPGSHRYPVGFSGDTVNSWASLDFQPYFTATASNIGYGWWSHDIGGHMFGYRDEELVTRWFQLGVFSPINRLHSTLNPFMGKEPWKFNPIAEAVMAASLRLRHRLLPYLYTMNERAHRLGEPIVTPLYYGAAGQVGHTPVIAEVESQNSFFFGTELLVAPITSPAIKGINLGVVKTWLPEGTWTDWFTGLRYSGGRWVRLHRPLSQLPVLAKAGAIIPLSGEDYLGTDNPPALEVHLFAGADGAFSLYEDDDATDPRSVVTELSYRESTHEFTIGAAQGAVDLLPTHRRYTLVVHGLDGLDLGTQIDLGEVPTATGRTITLAGELRPADARVAERVFELVSRAEIAYATKDAVWAAIQQHESLAGRLVALQGLELEPALFAALSELLLAQL
ncbi:MAG: TIM-barrel domain-containing protein [Micropruina sp.]